MNTFKQNIFKMFKSAIIFGLFLRVSGWVTNAMASKGRRERKELTLVAEGTVSQGWRVLYSRGPQPPASNAWWLEVERMESEQKERAQWAKCAWIIPQPAPPQHRSVGKVSSRKPVLKRLGAVLQSSGSPEGVIPTRPCRGHLSMSADTFLLSWLGRGVLLESNRLRWGMLLNIQQHTGQAPPRPAAHNKEWSGAKWQ